MGESILGDLGSKRSAASNFVAAAITSTRSFVGREAELGRLRETMAASARSTVPGNPSIPIAIIGLGGVGKSQLAMRFAERACTALGGGKPTSDADWNLFDCAWWVNGSLAGHDESIRDLAIQMGHEPTRDDSPLRLRAMVAKAMGDGRRHLLILDNLQSTPVPLGAQWASHDPWNVVHELTPPGPSQLLITTRENRLRAARVTCIELQAFTTIDAISVLSQARPGLLDIELAQIAAHLGNLPLAVALAGAWLSQHPEAAPTDLLNQLKSSDAATMALFDADELGEEANRNRRTIAGLLKSQLEGLAGKPATRLLDAAAYASPDDIPLTLLSAVAGTTKAETLQGALHLADRGIVQVQPAEDGGSLSLHRVTQLAVRAWLASSDREGPVRILNAWLAALIDLYQWPVSQSDQLTDHTRTPARIAAIPHAEAILSHSVPSPVTARFRSMLAARYRDLGQLASATQHLDAAIGWGESQSARDERSLAIDYASRASIRQYRGDLAGAEADIKQAIDWSEAQFPRDERSLAIWYASRARIRQDRGDLAGAEADIARSIDWGEAQSPRNERSLAIDYASRASIRRYRGDLAGAEADIARSIAWGEAQSPRDERGLAIDYASRASIRQDMGDLAGAEHDIQRSIAWSEAQSPCDERGLASLYASRASIRQNRGLLKDAEEDLQKSISWGEAQSPRDERSLAIMYASRATIRQQRGFLKEADDDIAEAIAWSEAQSPRDERSLAILYVSRARIQRDQAAAVPPAVNSVKAEGLLARAKADIAAALAWWERNLPGDERTLGMWREDQALIELAARSALVSPPHEPDHPIRLTAGPELLAESYVIERQIRRDLGLAWDAPLDAATLGRVEKLDLRGEPISDTGAAWLARADSGLNALTWLCLAYTTVTDAGLQAICRVGTSLRSLTVLDLRYTRVTDAGVQALARVDTGLNALRVLDLSHTQVTAAGVKAITARFPDVKVRH